MTEQDIKRYAMSGLYPPGMSAHEFRTKITDLALKSLRPEAEEKAIDLLCEMQGLLEAFACRVEMIAFEMKPPNVYTPQFEQTVQYVRNELTKIKMRGLPRGPQRNESSEAK